MANFIEAYNKTAINEGGYNNAAWDPGGETYAGISRVYNPQWAGWTTIDQLKNNYQNGKIPYNTKFSSLNQSVQSFYRANYWNKIMGDQLKNQALANLMYDFAVQSGVDEIDELQKSINQVAGKKVVEVDGDMGPMTLAAANAADQVKLHNALLDRRTKYYQQLLASGIINSVAWNGIVARLSRYPYLTAAAVSAGSLLFVAGLFFLITRLNKST